MVTGFVRPPSGRRFSARTASRARCGVAKGRAAVPGFWSLPLTATWKTWPVGESARRCQAKGSMARARAAARVRVRRMLHSSQRVDHLFAAVLRVTDESLSLRIDDPVHQLKWYLPDQYGE